MMRIAVLLSGRGSNFKAIHDAIASRRLDAEIVAVVSNRPEAPGLALAEQLGYRAVAADHGRYRTRELHEAAVLEIIEPHRPDYVVLAGYMRIIASLFRSAYPDRILNIHPSLLPAFPGLDAQKQAIEHGVTISGCTVHLVNEQLDGGPILVQRAVPVLDDDTPGSLAARILAEEHLAYVEALVKLSAGPPHIDDRRVCFAQNPVGRNGTSAAR